MGLADEMDDDLKTYQRLIKSYTDLLLLEKHTCKLLPHGQNETIGGHNCMTVHAKSAHFAQIMILRKVAKAGRKSNF